MPAQRIAENLAFINWTLLTGLGVGAFGAVVLMRLRTAATRGFLGFSAACAAGFGLLAHLSDGALVQAAAAPGSTVTIDPTWSAPRDGALIAFTVLALLYALVLARRMAPLVAAAGLAAGVAALAFGALAWGGGPLGTAVALGQELLLAAATGGVFVAMILGHWYLVTPKLPEGPLILLSRVLFGLVAAQVILFAASMLLGAGSGRWPVLAAHRAVGPVRLAASPGRPRLSPDRFVGGDPDRAVAFDGVGNRAAVYQRWLDCRGHDPGSGPLLRSRADRMRLMA